MATPYATTHLTETRSTQDEARSRFDESQPVLVTAQRQTAGRGRGGREWWNAPRALAASLAVQPAWPRNAWPRLSLVAGLAIRSVVGSLDLKWPNDVLRETKKVGGILSESSSQGVVVGLGLNLWWPNPPQGVAALYPEDPGAAAAGEMAQAWAEELLRRLEGPPEAWGREEYIAACSTLGREIIWDSGRGVARTVDERGRLVVETADGDVALGSGEVRSVRPTTLHQE